MWYSPLKPLAAAIQFLSNTLPRRQKSLILALVDALLLAISVYTALGLRFSTVNAFPEIGQYGSLLFLLIILKLVLFRSMGLYRPILRYTGSEFILTTSKAVLLGSGALVFIAYWLESWPLPRSVLIIDGLISLVLVVGVRLSLRWFVHHLIASAKTDTPQERVVVYGAGEAGSQLARMLANEKGYQPVAFVDDNVTLHGLVVQGLTVYPPSDLSKLLRKKPFDTILLAIPSASQHQLRRILDFLQMLPVRVKTVPSMAEVLNGSSLRAIRNIDITDLLGRQEVPPDRELLRLDVTGKSVLVTGAGGSIGSELCRQIARAQPKRLVLYERSEFALYSIDLELAESFPDLERSAVLGSVTNPVRFNNALAQHEIDTIYHAAAYKHVPLVEHNPAQGILNNIYGTLTVAQCAIEQRVNSFVLISTDKAVRPTNVMGATKRVAELILQALADLPQPIPRFTIVRFGNVLDSSGSVVPRFRKQIARGQPITLTHPEITRYFMSIPEAARLVMQAGAMGKGGEVFLLDMGEPVRIYDLAAQMIRLSGLVPGQDIKIHVTGLRPGEKLYEELLIGGDNINPTKHSKIFSARESKLSWTVLQPRLDALFAKARCDYDEGIRADLRALVPEYRPSNTSSARRLKSKTDR